MFSIMAAIIHVLAEVGVASLHMSSDTHVLSKSHSISSCSLIVTWICNFEILVKWTLISPSGHLRFPFENCLFQSLTLLSSFAVFPLLSWRYYLVLVINFPFLVYIDFLFSYGLLCCVKSPSWIQCDFSFLLSVLKVITKLVLRLNISSVKIS